jgi:hypothetical protein
MSAAWAQKFSGIDQQLREVRRNRALVRSFFKTTSAAYVLNC